MKKLLFSASVLLMATGAFAQTNKMTGNDARIGIKAGVNLASFSGKGAYSNVDYTNNVGFNLTAFGDFGVGNNFFIQPGISLQNKGAKIENSVGNSVFTSAKDNLMAIEVPINAVLRIPTGNAGAFQINAGPYVGFNIAGKRTGEISTSNNSTSSDRDLSFGNTNAKDYSGTDFGANFGLAYRTNSGILVGANYGMGLTNLVPKDRRSGDDKLTNRVIGLSVGYSF